jgi:glycyl-tRNA synthetase beta chain
MKGQFLLEIGTEEIPAGYIDRALDALSAHVLQALDNARIDHADARTYATPRRLILVVNGVAETQKTEEIVKTGPPVSSAYDEQGKPTKAAVGFARSQGVEVEELTTVDTPKGQQVAVRRVEQARPSRDVVGEFLPGILERLPFPKTMRWMDLDVRFARPVHWLLAILDSELVPFVFGNLRSGTVSRGHRFTHPGEFRVGSFEELRRTLAEQGILIDPDERRERIRTEVHRLAKDVDRHIAEDEELLNEVNYLVESPFAVMGGFAPDFLELPASVLITCMKKHQRYFGVRDSDGRLTDRFIAVNNTPVRDPLVSIRGHERVLRARLEDARFYFREDRKAPLIDRLEALKGVVFHSKLGTSYEKVQRFAKLAKDMGKIFVPQKLDSLQRAALLCKCDLETGIVYEFPELQGIIGSFYAQMDGETEEVSTAVREHYLPAHAGDKLPTGILGAILSIADRIDTIVGCFSVGLRPTGATDPYALRRHALGVIQILIHLEKPLDLQSLVGEALELFAAKRTRDRAEVENEVMDFIRTRFVNWLTSRGYPLDAVEAAVRARFDDVVDAHRRAEALTKWKERPDFDSLMIGFKRVVNILKHASAGPPDEDLFSEPQETALYEAFQGVRSRALPLIKEGRYFEALELIAELKSPIDEFFDNVLVMVEDVRVKANRLALLSNIADLFAQVADFSFVGSTAQQA